MESSCHNCDSIPLQKPSNSLIPVPKVPCFKPSASISVADPLRLHAVLQIRWTVIFTLTLPRNHIHGALPTTPVGNVTSNDRESNGHFEFPWYWHPES